MGHIINRDLPEDQLIWNADIIMMAFESPIVRRAKGARLLSHCISITRMIFNNEMRTYDQMYYSQTVDNFITNALTEISTNREYLDIKNFILDIFYARITYDQITKEQINRFVEVYYGMLSDAVEEVRMKTEVWDYVEEAKNAEDDPIEDDDDGIHLTPERLREIMEDEGYQTDEPRYVEDENAIVGPANNDPDSIPDEEDIQAMANAIDDEIETVYSNIGDPDDQGNDM